MEHSQLLRNYKVFNTKVEEPYELARELSSGDFIGKSYESQDDGLTLEEIESYIKANHVEPQLEF